MNYNWHIYFKFNELLQNKISFYIIPIFSNKIIFLLLLKKYFDVLQNLEEIIRKQYSIAHYNNKYVTIIN